MFGFDFGFNLIRLKSCSAILPITYSKLYVIIWVNKHADRYSQYFLTQSSV